MAMNKRRSYQPSDEFRGQTTIGTVGGRGKAGGLGRVSAATIDRSGSEEVDLDKKPKRKKAPKYDAYGTTAIGKILGR